ncbi:MAG: LytTR family DNA-binding domain-containing protein [Bacteroidota bacterium]
MKLKAVIIDDERDARFMLRTLITQFLAAEVELLGEADDVEPGRVLIEQVRPDLVFLDVRMKKGNGFDMLRQLPEVDFDVVFVTAYDQYAVKAFQFSAFGYLLKPVKIDELRAVVLRALKQKELLKSGGEHRFNVLIDNYGDHQQMKRLVISSMKGFDVVEIQDIIRLESENNYTHFIFSGQKKITSTRTIKEYEELLNSYGFHRIHQRHIVNLRHVKAYLRGDGGEVSLSTGEILPVSRSRKQSFTHRFLK